MSPPTGEVREMNLKACSPGVAGEPKQVYEGHVTGLFEALDERGYHRYIAVDGYVFDVMEIYDFHHGDDVMIVFDGLGACFDHGAFGPVFRIANENRITMGQFVSHRAVLSSAFEEIAAEFSPEDIRVNEAGYVKRGGQCAPRPER